MNRRSFLGRVAAALAVAPVALVAGTAPRAEAREADCAECARLFDGERVLPAMFARSNPGIIEMARDATHALALRKRISHDEAALEVYWQGFPTYTTVEASEADKIAALVDDVLANPGKHPELEARARELMGGTLTIAEPYTLVIRNTAPTGKHLDIV